MPLELINMVVIRTTRIKDERVIYMASSILKTEKLCKSFSNGGRQQHVIKNLDMEIIEGDFTVIMGASGSGKSTLLYALSGMDKPSMGKILFGDTEIQDYSNDELAVFRRGNCGFVFQSVYLLENQTILDNVLTGALIVQKNCFLSSPKARSMPDENHSPELLTGMQDAIWPCRRTGGCLF